MEIPLSISDELGCEAELVGAPMGDGAEASEVPSDVIAVDPGGGGRARCERDADTEPPP